MVASENMIESDVDGIIGELCALQPEEIHAALQIMDEGLRSGVINAFQSLLIAAKSEQRTEAQNGGLTLGDCGACEDEESDGGEGLDFHAALHDSEANIEEDSDGDHAGELQVGEIFEDVEETEEIENRGRVQILMADCSIKSIMGKASRSSGFTKMDGLLLGKLWPADRVLLGTRVSKWLRDILENNASHVVVNVSGRGKGALADVSRAISRFRHEAVEVRMLAQSCAGLVTEVLPELTASIDNGWGGTIAHLDAGQNMLRWGVGADPLFAFLQRCSALQHLSLAKNNLLGKGATRLAPALRHCAALTELDLSDNAVGPKGAARLCPLIAACSALTSLNLARNQLGDDGAGQLGVVLERCKRLRRLDLSYNELHRTGSAELAAGLGRSAGLAELELGHNPLHSDGFLELAGGLRECGGALEHLGLSRTAPGAAGIRWLSEALGGGTRLGSLDLSCNDIEGTSAGRLAGALRGCGALRTLDLGSNRVGDAAAGAVAGALAECRALTSLDLRLNKIGAQGAAHVARELRGSSTLGRLVLSYNQIGARGAESLAGLVEGNRALSALVLRMTTIRDEGLRLLAGALGGCLGLSHLDLGCAKVGDCGAAALAEALPGCGQLRTLALNDNAVGNAGAERLAGALPHCARLAALELNGNQIGNAGAAALVAALRRAPALALLDLSRNSILGVPDTPPELPTHVTITY